MFFRNVVKELREIKGIGSIPNKWGEEKALRFKKFVLSANKGESYTKHLKTIREASEILDVPPEFIVRMLELQEVEDIETD